MALSSLPYRASPSPVFAGTTGSISAGNVRCDVEGGLHQEH